MAVGMHLNQDLLQSWHRLEHVSRSLRCKDLAERILSALGPLFDGVAPSSLVANGTVVLDYLFYVLFLIRYRRYNDIADLLHV